MNLQNILSLLSLSVGFGLLGFFSSLGLARLSGGIPTPLRCSLLGGLLSLAFVAVIGVSVACNPTANIDWTRCAIVAIGASASAAALGYKFSGEQSPR